MNEWLRDQLRKRREVGGVSKVMVSVTQGPLKKKKKKNEKKSEVVKV